MKSLVVVLLVAFCATSSLTAASDTLRIVTHRTIDVCSEERRWLISASIGEVYSSDSLQSFDITIGFDTSRVTPTDGLITGTLADQMRFGDMSPFFNFSVPGEARVGAFTITRNVKGDLPLFAIAGSYKGSCQDQDTFSLPWEPSFNGEFKGIISFFASDTILTVVNAIADSSQGSAFDTDTLHIAGIDSSGTAIVRVSQSKMKGLTVIETFDFASDKLVEINSVESAQQIDSSSVSKDKQRVTLWRTVGEEDEFVVTIHMTSITASEDTTATGTYDIRVTSECSCVTPVKRGSLVVRSQTKTTSAVTERDVHESTDPRIRYANETLEFQCSHGQLWRVTVVDIVGRVVKTAEMNTTETTRLSLGDLPAGAYIVYATDRKDALVQTIVK